MTDLDDAEELANACSRRPNDWEPTGRSNKGYKAFLERGRRTVAESGSLRLSAYEPSLPKLKFMGEK